MNIGNAVKKAFSSLRVGGARTLVKNLPVRGVLFLTSVPRWTIHNERPRNPPRKEKTVSDEKNNPDNLTDKIRLVMWFGMTPKQEAEIKAAAARAGVTLMVYLYNLVRTEPGRFIVPLGPTARQAGAASSGCGSPQSDSVPR